MICRNGKLCQSKNSLSSKPSLSMKSAAPFSSLNEEQSRFYLVNQRVVWKDGK